MADDKLTTIPANDNNSDEIAKILANLKSDSSPDKVAAKSMAAISAEPLHEASLDVRPSSKLDGVEDTGKTPESAVASSIDLPKSEASEEASVPPGADDILREYQASVASSRSLGSDMLRRVGGILLAALPYLLVFGIGVAGYYLFIADDSSKWNIQFWKKEVDPTSAVEEDRVKAVEEAQKNNKAAYDKWIGQFFFTVTDKSLLEMDTVCPNGFTNFENFLLKLNPKTRDANNNGRIDSLDVLEGVNPETGKSLSDSQKDALAKYISSDEVKKRGSAPSSGSGLQIRGPARSAGLVASASDVQILPQGSTDTNIASVPSGAGKSVRSSGSGNANESHPLYENKLGINTSKPGRIEIPSLKINVPIIWTEKVENFDTDLRRGVVHHPHTPLPGDAGTSYISGHSSNYAWVKADFNKVFEKLNDLAVGATFNITVVDAKGKDVKLYYTVDSKQIFQADDQSQFLNFAESKVALSTCWPIGTLEKRLVVFAKLTRVE